MRIALMAVLIVVMSSIPGFAAKFDIDYFNGIKWGSKIGGFNGFKYVSNGTLGEKYYSRSSDKSTFEGIKVEDFIYTAKNGVLRQSHFLFEGDSNYQKVRRFLVVKFMKVERMENGFEVFRLYNGKRFVNAMLQYNGGRGMVNFSFTGDEEVNKAYRAIEKLN